MNDFEALKRGMADLELKFGAVARNRMIWRALRKSMDEPTRRLANRLSDELATAQGKRGIHNPSCGELMAAEILFQVWLLEERGE